MNKGLRIMLIVIAALVGIVALVLLGFRLVMRIPVASYYRASEKAFVIPGLDESFVPQGFHYDDENGYFLVSGYSAESGVPSTMVVLYISPTSPTV